MIVVCINDNWRVLDGKKTDFSLIPKKDCYYTVLEKKTFSNENTSRDFYNLEEGRPIDYYATDQFAPVVEQDITELTEIL